MTPRHQRRPQVHSLLCLAYFLTTSLASPVTSVYNDTTHSTPPSPVLVNTTISSDRHALVMPWLWGLVWGDESTVSVVDRTPVMSFAGRPAAFGPQKDVLGYMIRVEDFSVPCDDNDEGGDEDEDNGDEDEDNGGGIHDPPWWPGGGAEEGWGQERIDTQDARYGCPKLCVGGEHKPEVSETWIALIMRGGCSFVEKVREAQRFGAKGVVVGGENAGQDAHGDGLVQMYSLGDASDITIPSVYISHASYNTLSTLIASSNTSTWGLRTVSVGITTDPSGWDWYSYVLHPYISYILLFLPSTLTLLTLLIHRVRSARAARRERAPENVVHNLPWRIWEGQQTVVELEKLLDAGAVEEVEQNLAAGGEGEGIPEPSTSRMGETEEVQTPAVAIERHWYDTQGECAICLEDFAKGDKVRVLPCRHIFHMEEVDGWLIRRKKLCPICKHDVTLPLGAEPSSEGDDDEASTGNNSASERTPLLQSLSP